VTVEEKGKGKSKAGKPRGITFKCRLCERSRPLDEMVVLTRFFPPVVACKDCAKMIDSKENREEDREEDKEEDKEEDREDDDV